MRKLILQSTLFLVTVCLLAGCVLIRSSSISDSTGAGNPVNASVSDMGFVELIAPEGLTHNANQQLASQCPGGKFTDVQNELSERDFFLVQLYSLSANAVCQ